MAAENAAEHQRVQGWMEQALKRCTGPANHLACALPLPASLCLLAPVSRLRG